jgi:guanine nucleotide exchange factor VAV
MAAVETQEMWRFCANWLLQLEVIPKNHRVMTSDATFQDLAYTLRDGVLLCHIASTIDENSISPRSINHRPQMAQFLCLQNIRLFLTACKVGHTIIDLFMFNFDILRTEFKSKPIGIGIKNQM